MEELRTVEILRAGVWHNSDFEDIKKGDIFRMFEPANDTSVKDPSGNCIFKAVSGIYTHPEINVLTVDTVGIDATDEELGIYDDGTQN